MATRQLTRKTRKPIRNRRTPIEDLKAVGDEPVWEEGNKPSRLEIANALRYYGYHTDTKNNVKVVVQHVKTNYRNLAKYKPVDHQIPLTLGNLIQMKQAGCNLPKSYQEYIDTKIREIFKKSETPQTEVSTTRKSPVELLSEKTGNLIAELEGYVDTEDPSSMNVYEFLQANDCSIQSANAIIAFYKPQLDFMKSAKKDKTLSAGYAHVNMTRALKILNNIVNDTNAIIEGKKAVRKPRAVKKKTTQDKVKGFKYMSQSNEHKLTSVPPEKIIGASCVLLFNTKYSSMTIIHTDNDIQGLQIKGQSIINIDPAKSGTKRMGRKLNELPKYLKATKTTATNAFKRIKANKTECSGRVGNDTIIMKVWK